MHDVFYFTDVHGCYPLFRAAMDFCVKQDPECMIIYGGDACDRGTDGYKIMRELLGNPQVMYLKGNHEDLFVHAAWAIKREYEHKIDEDLVWSYLYNEEMSDYGNHDVQLCLFNGGYQTLHDWMMDGMPMNFVNKIQYLPVTFSYENLDFCHAGGRPKEFKNIQIAEYNNDFISNDDLMMAIWDRNYLGQGWIPNRTCIFGHTPTTYLAAKYYGRDKSLTNVHPCAYNATLDDKWTGRKIDMDTCAVASGRLYVLNCLTMKAYGFKDIDLDHEVINHRVEQFEVIQF